MSVCDYEGLGWVREYHLYQHYINDGEAFYAILGIVFGLGADIFWKSFSGLGYLKWIVLLYSAMWLFIVLELDNHYNYQVLVQRR